MVYGGLRRDGTLPVIKASWQSGMTEWRRNGAALAILSALILILFPHDGHRHGGDLAGKLDLHHCILILPIVAWLYGQRLPGSGK